VIASANSAGGPDARHDRHRETTALLGMSVFVASWAMLFAALFFAYGVTRSRALAWPPADLPALPLGPPALATLAITGASAALIWARRRDAATRALPLALAGAGGMAFLAIQVGTWRALFLAGLRPETGTYASVFYGLTTFHALHVLVGLVGLATLLAGAVRARRSPAAANPIPLRLWTVYFHMVGVLWLLLFIGVYCL
jgi:heme/copper-type cytochrome/quinol oxidase subunit 3